MFTLAGKMIVAHRTHEALTIASLSLALQIDVARTEFVPRASVHIIWPQPRPLPSTDTWNLQCYFSTISEETVDEYFSMGLNWCSVCMDPYHEADLREAEEKFLRCYPMCLCPHCKTQIGGTIVCFNCLKKKGMAASEQMAEAEGYAGGLCLAVAPRPCPPRHRWQKRVRAVSAHRVRVG